MMGVSSSIFVTFFQSWLFCLLVRSKRGVVIDDTNSPVHNVCFLNLEVGRGGIVHKAALDKARHWSGLLDVVIRRADQARVRDVNVVQNGKSKDAKPSGSVADELKKLADLKADGVLTEDEFQTQKQRLLSRV